MKYWESVTFLKNFRLNRKDQFKFLNTYFGVYSLKYNGGIMNFFRLIFITIVLLFSSNYIAIAQDSTETDDDWEWNLEEVEDYVDWKTKQPTMSINYGISDISRTDVEAPFADNNLIELKLGYTTNRASRFADFIEKHRYNYLLLNKNSTELAGSSESASEIETSNWQFGIAWSGGYGYKAGSEALITLYFTSMLSWTNLDFNDDSLSANDERVKGLYDETFRFGSGMEAGLRVQATKLVTVEAGYERSIVFERHLFWKWAGSGLIEIVAQGLVDTFVKEIFKSSPAAGPVVNFLLKGALGYGLYELRQDKMNWPFPSAPPIAFDNIKFGATFVF